MKDSELSSLYKAQAGKGSAVVGGARVSVYEQERLLRRERDFRIRLARNCRQIEDIEKKLQKPRLWSVK